AEQTSHDREGVPEGVEMETTDKVVHKVRLPASIQHPTGQGVHHRRKVSDQMVRLLELFQSLPLFRLWQEFQWCALHFELRSRRGFHVDAALGVSIEQQ